MIAAELHAGGKPSLSEALSWIGLRVDDIYGATVGALEDVWIDPGTGEPRWLLVRDGSFAGRTTLIPFDDATAGAGHVWVPYERGVVDAAPAITTGAPLTQQAEAALRGHFEANAPASMSHAAAEAPSDGDQGATTIHFQPAAGAAAAGPPGVATYPPTSAAIGGAPAAPQPSVVHRGNEPHPAPPAHPAPPIVAPEQPHQAPAGGWAQQSYGVPAPVHPGYQQPPQQSPGVAAPAQGAIEQLQALAGAGGSHYIEIELSGELTIRGELRSVRVIPRGPGA